MGIENKCKKGIIVPIHKKGDVNVFLKREKRTMALNFSLKIKK